MQNQIEEIYAKIGAGDTSCLQDVAVRACVESVIQGLDDGTLRVATPAKTSGADWETHGWIQKAILLYFQLSPMRKMEVGPFLYHDKIPLKKHFPQVRVVP